MYFALFISKHFMYLILKIEIYVFKSETSDYQANNNSIKKSTIRPAITSAVCQPVSLLN
jgi:hypothetical protein